MAIESKHEGSDKGSKKLQASDRISEAEAIGETEQNKQFIQIQEEQDENFSSMTDYVSQGEKAGESFQLLDDGDTVASAKNTKQSSDENLGSYAEGLKAITPEQRAKYDTAYINRKAKELGYEPVEVDTNNQAATNPLEKEGLKTTTFAQLSTPEIRLIDPKIEVMKVGADAENITQKAEQIASNPLLQVIKELGHKISKPKEINYDPEKSESQFYAHRGKEDDYMDYEAHKEAFKAFPEFKNHQSINWELIAALVRNEQHYYLNFKEKGAEMMINDGKGDEVYEKKSIGPAQIQVRSIKKLVEKYPQLTDPALGGIRKDHILVDALKPEKAAWLATAYVANKIELNEELGEPVTPEKLIQDWNPGGKPQHDHVMKQYNFILKKFSENNKEQHK